MTNIVEYNRKAWDAQVDKKDRWTVPVGAAEIALARKGEWSVLLTPTTPVPRTWFPDLRGLRLLGLASGGGQQGPLFAAAGAEVTIFDNSPKQLEQDRRVSDAHDLGIRTVQGDMRNLSVFEPDSFDLIFNPCSILFVDTLQPVWEECFRVLRPGGILMTGLLNPLAYQIDEEDLKLKYAEPYSDLHSLPKEKLEAFIEKQEPMLFGHTWTDQLGGQLQAGFSLTHLFEDGWGGNHVFDQYFRAFMATRAVKPN